MKEPRLVPLEHDAVLALCQILGIMLDQLFEGDVAGVALDRHCPMGDRFCYRGIAKALDGRRMAECVNLEVVDLSLSRV